MLHRLGIHDFRNLNQIELELPRGTTLLHGPNGSGKTSILEGIYYLATGRSFRTHLIEPLIRHGCSRFVLSAELQDSSGQRHQLGIERGFRRTRRRLNGEDVATQGPLSRLFPVLAIHPDTHLLVSGPPSLRRRFIDWGCFHQFPEFSRLWAQFTRLARHRAALLRSSAETAELRSIDHALVPIANKIDQYRSRFLERFIPCWHDLLHRVFQDVPSEIELEYLRGWGEELSIADALAFNLARDRRLGRTSAGPHRASFHLLTDGKPVARVFSRGQQKLLALSLALAQSQLLSESEGRTPLLLIDDLASELDRHHIDTVTSYLSGNTSQVILTAVDHRHLLDRGIQPDAMFHVKHGGVGEDGIMP